MRLRSGDKHHLRKYADRKAQISLVSGTNAVLICAFRSADFLRWCLCPERNLTHNLFFYFQLFLVLIWFIFSMRRRTVQTENRSFVSVLRSPVTPFDRSDEECELFRGVQRILRATEVWTQRHSRRESEKEVHIFGKEKCKTVSQFQRY